MSIILIVDDAKTDRELMGKVVTMAGHHPEFATDGSEALAKVKALRPALVLMDVCMPNQDGYTTCRELKKDPETSKVPIVLVTSKGQVSDKYWGQRQGAQGYVVKPFTRETLAMVIKRFVGPLPGMGISLSSLKND